MPLGPFTTVFVVLVYAAAAVYCFFLPGYALWLAVSSRKPLTWLEQLAVASALSVALYPLLYLWSYVLGLSLGPAIAWVPGGAGLVVAVWKHHASVRAIMPRIGRLQDHWGDIAAVGLVATLALSRLHPVRQMIAPAWGDSVHHTMIVQLLLDNRGLFQSWAPYAPIESFTYHFGFHTSIAAWATVTGLAAPKAVIIGGQILNVLAIVAVYPLAVRLGGGRTAGLCTLVVAGLVSLLPGMYVNWGRYTQLTAQIILPVWLWALDVWWTEDERPRWRTLVLFTILSAGLALTHYRVAVVALCAAVAWGGWSLWVMRARLREWLVRTAGLAVAGVAALAAIMPWVLTLRSSRMTYIAGAIAQRSTELVQVRSEPTLWRDIGAHYAPYLLVVALVALLMALWRRRQLAVPLLLWMALAFVAANPFLIRIAGTGIVTNFLLLLGLYIPMSLLAGWLLGEVGSLAGSLRAGDLALGRIAFAAALIVVSVVGIRRQASIVDPFYQMITAADAEVMEWVGQNVPDDSHILANAFPAYDDALVVGSDAGWWLPYYTQHATNVPPILYSVEALSPDVERDGLLQLVFDLQDSQGEPMALRAILCEHDVTHVYLGDRQGQVGYGETQLIQPEWLQDNADFRLLREEGAADIWSFDRGVCDRPQ